MSNFTSGIAYILAADEYNRMLEAGRVTVPGEALARAVYGVAGVQIPEPQAAAARRLKVSPGRLSKLIATYRKQIEETGVLESDREQNS